MAAKLQVMKFGGTFVGNAECIKRTAEIISRGADGETAVVAVVSAMSGVTNRLVETARAAAKGDTSAPQNLAEHLLTQHRAAIETLITDEAERAALDAEISRLVDEVRNLCHG